jgi:hypothetical protein
MQKTVVIRLPITVGDSQPDIGVGVEDETEIKDTIYQYLRELMDNDQLHYTIEDGSNA